MHGIFTGLQGMDGILLIAFEKEQEAKDYLDEFYKKVEDNPEDFYWEKYDYDLDCEYDNEGVKAEGKALEERKEKAEKITEAFKMFFPDWYFGCGEPNPLYIDKLKIGKPVLDSWDLD